VAVGPTADVAWRRAGALADQLAIRTTTAESFPRIPAQRPLAGIETGQEAAARA
jgi:hypothetical protein